MSLDRVPGSAELYIGGLISLRRYDALKKANITHVVSALRGLDLDQDLFKAYKHHVVELNDMDDEDIIQYFPETNAFIQEGLDGGGGVLVHCAMGKSRSATLCVAYMLSRSRGSDLTPTAALDAIKMARPVVEPNPGFMAQLELYHGMGCPEYIQAEPAYQRWQYQQEVELSVACGRAPDTIRFEDEAVPLASRSGSAAVHAANRLETPQTLGSEVEVRCRRCRRSLARTPYIVPHTPKPASATQAARAAQSGPIDSLDDELASDRTSAVANSPCAHIFLDPLSWMRPELEQGKLDGKLECPNEKCRTKVGQYAWQGMRCSCGQWVTPAISLARSRIDEVKARPVGPRQQSVPGKI